MNTVPDYEPAEEYVPPTDAAILAESSYDRLRRAIAERVEFHFRGVDFPPDMPRIYAEALAEFVDGGIQKFRDGQLEHGGDFREKDMDSNIQEEVTDLVMYVIGKKIQPAFLKFIL